MSLHALSLAGRFFCVVAFLLLEILGMGVLADTSVGANSAAEAEWPRVCRPTRDKLIELVGSPPKHNGCWLFKSCHHFNFAYSALACLRTGISGSASSQS